MINRYHSERIPAAGSITLDSGEDRILFFLASLAGVTLEGSYDNQNFEALGSTLAPFVTVRIETMHRFYRFTGTPGTRVSLIGVPAHAVVLLSQVITAMTMTPATDGFPGGVGFVTAPPASSQNYFLGGDATWKPSIVPFAAASRYAVGVPVRSPNNTLWRSLLTHTAAGSFVSDLANLTNIGIGVSTASNQVLYDEEFGRVMMTGTPAPLATNSSVSVLVNFIVAQATQLNTLLTTGLATFQTNPRVNNALPFWETFPTVAARGGFRFNNEAGLNRWEVARTSTNVLDFFDAVNVRSHLILLPNATNDTAFTIVASAILGLGSTTITVASGQNPLIAAIGGNQAFRINSDHSIHASIGARNATTAANRCVVGGMTLNAPGGTHTGTLVATSIAQYNATAGTLVNPFDELSFKYTATTTNSSGSKTYSIRLNGAVLATFPTLGAGNVWVSRIEVDMLRISSTSVQIAIRTFWSNSAGGAQDHALFFPGTVVCNNLDTQTNTLELFVLLGLLGGSATCNQQRVDYQRANV